MGDLLPGEPHELRFAQFTLRPQQRLLLENGHPVKIGSRALDILIALLKAPGQVLSKQALMATAWPGVVVDEGSLRVQMTLLRKALGEAAAGRAYIQNVPQRGYCFVEPVHADAGPATAGPPAAPTPASASAPAPPPSPRGILPAHTLRLLGREPVLASITEQLPRRHFVTLVGPGGIGKTALALAAAQRVAAQGGDPAYFVDLAPLLDASRVASALAAALGVQALSDDPVPQVLAMLAGRPALIVLDNCEHVIEAAARLAEQLLHGAPGLQLLATSREPLRAQGEWVVRIAALGWPEPGGLLTPAEALAYPAVELLVERAAATTDGFTLAAHDVPFAVQLCRRLDGIPLAIELVATRVASFGLRELAEHMDQRLALTVHGRRTALPRHQTLQATLAWSYGLLDAYEQRVLRRLSVFRGRFSLASALVLAGGVAPAEPLGDELALELIAGLVAKSLLATEGRAGEMSYRLLETTRAFAAEQLAHSDEHALLQRCHAVHMAELLEAAERELLSLSPAGWRSLHGGRIDDVRRALEWAFAAGGDPMLGVSLTAASAPLWFHLGLVREYRERLARAAEVAAGWPAEPLRDMRLALALGHALLHLDGAGEPARAALARSLGIAEQLGRPHDQLRALWGLFTERMMCSDYAGAHQMAQAFGHAAQQAGDPPSAATHDRLIAMALHMQGDHGNARRHAEAALRVPAVNVQYLHGSAYQVDHEASAMTPLARVLWLQGRPAEAMRLAELAVSRATMLDHGFSMTYTLALAALPIALWSGDLDAAQRHALSLRQCTQRHSLQFWQTWCSLYEQVIATRLAPAAAMGVDAAWLAEAAAHPGRADMLATLGEPWLSSTAMARLAAGCSGWCAAEVQRARVVRAWQAGEASVAETESALRVALQLARAQGALAWELRIGVSLLQLRAAPPAAELAEELAAVLAQFEPGAHTADLAQARALLQTYRTAGFTASTSPR